MPTWIPDSKSSNCSCCSNEIKPTIFNLCKVTFQISTNKHHCRKCGKIICQSCVEYEKFRDAILDKSSLRYKSSYESSTRFEEHKVCRNCRVNKFLITNESELEERLFEMSQLTGSPSGPLMTGGAIFQKDWTGLGNIQKDSKVTAAEIAQMWAQLYIDARKGGAALNYTTETLELSDQAIHNLNNSKRLSPFSGLIDCRTNKIFLVPATARKGQAYWQERDLLKQHFTRYGFLGANRLETHGRTLYSKNENIFHYNNMDHGNAATIVDERFSSELLREISQDQSISLNTRNKQFIYKTWMVQQRISSDWLGFFVCADSQGNYQFNFKSAQLNVPNLFLPNLDLKETFQVKTREMPKFGVSVRIDGKEVEEINKKNKKLKYSKFTNECLYNATQLPKKLQDLIENSFKQALDNKVITKPPINSGKVNGKAGIS
ncbi:FYVE zinc finger domain-containing protein [Vibrio sp. S4M6]|uniref:FYVE zinc finger domain-containing protein n=1 Tax=Vibrio sinus TaxID=2946865 RepID=UPI00202A83F7|nr:FYVE zinc finger domain-containing protein [Vibrio sinus]MCL9779918.1 FYVE zinc finger domain-containing protein [Vibrio sinus]